MKEIRVFSKDGCPFCSLLKMELDKKGLEFELVDLSDDSLRASFYQTSGVTTVPQLYLNGERIGGWSEVSKNWQLFD